MHLIKKNKKLIVLLVASEKTDVGFGRAVKIPSLGLASIAANCDRSICDVHVLDLVVARNPESCLRKVVNRYMPDVVGFSCMTFQYAATLALARMIKAIHSESIVVIGGYHPTVAYNLILNSKEEMRSIDFLIRNEGERAFNALLKALYYGDDLTAVPNCSYIDNGTIRHNKSDDILDLNQIKIQDRNSRIVKKGFYLFGNRADVIETSRGCTCDCDFCSIQVMYGRRYRKYTVERVLQDIRDAQGHGARALFIADDNITLDGRRYKEVCEAIIDARVHTKFFIQASIRGLSRTAGLISTMASAGVKWIFLGIENVADNNLAFLDKHDQFIHAEVYEVVNELRRRNIIVIGGFIIGNPDDSIDTIRANYAYAKKLRLDVALFFIVTPFPGTVIREKLGAQGLITNPDDFDHYTCFKANVRTRHLSSEQLYALREEMGYRYPLDSGSYWRLAREFMAHPVYYITHMGFGQLMKDPMEVFRYLKGIKGMI